MKVKMLMAVAMSGLLAASLSYAEPADDMLAANDTDTGMQAPTTSTPDNVGAVDSSSQTTNNNNTGMNSGNTNSDSSADTATGDDDY